MLSGFPVYHYFKCGNTFTGAEGGMFYHLVADKGGEDRPPCLRVTVWPGPWSREHTAEEKMQVQTFSPDQSGLDAATAWLKEQYDARRDVWDNIPSILDCDPDR